MGSFGMGDGASVVVFWLLAATVCIIILSFVVCGCFWLYFRMREQHLLNSQKLKEASVKRILDMAEGEGQHNGS